MVNDLVFSQTTIEIESTTIRNYNENVISVKLKNLSDSQIKYFEGKIFYDNEYLKILGIDLKNNSIIKSKGLFISKVDTINCFVRFGWVDTNPLQLEGDLFNLIIRANKPGSTTLTTIDKSTNAETFLLRNGEVNCEVITSKIEIITSYVGFVQSAVYGTQAELELKFINMFNVGSFSFRIHYDQTNVEMLSVENIYKNISLIYNAKNGIINLGWYDISAFNPVNISDGRICTVKFNVQNYTGSLRFDAISEVTDDVGNKLLVKFENYDFTTITGVDYSNSLCNDYDIDQNYPNPFNPVTTIKYSTPTKGNVKVSVFNLIGEEIEILMNEELPAGEHTIQWNAANLSSGVYFYSIKAESSLGKTKYSAIKKMLLLK